MSTKRKVADQKDTDQMDPTGGNVEQIREILFGGHIRAFDDRFDLVESRLAKEMDSLRKAAEKQVLKLEQLLGEKHEELTDQLHKEINNRDLALNKMELAMTQARMDADNQMAEMQERFTSDIKAVKAELKAVHKELSTALGKAINAQDKRSDKLDYDKANRKDLSGFFSDIAQKLQPAEKGK